MKRVPGGQHLAGHLAKEESWCAIDPRSWKANYNEYQQQRERTQMEEVAGEVRSSRHELRPRRDVRGS